MRVLPVLSLALLTATGCALNSGPGTPERDVRPLEAMIIPDHGDGSFGPSYTIYTSHPAHVALFEVVPGQGIGMIYPSDDWHTGHVSGGIYRIVDIMPSHRWAYLRSPVRYASTGSQMRYLVLVASELPLRVGEFRESAFALRRELGYQTFAAYNPYETMEAVTELIVPPQHSAGVAVDVYAYMPNLLPNPRLAWAQVDVFCPKTGAVYTVSLERFTTLRQHCGTEIQIASTDGEPDDATEDDEGDGGEIPIPMPEWIGSEMPEVHSGDRITFEASDHAFGPALRIATLRPVRRGNATRESDDTRMRRPVEWLPWQRADDGSVRPPRVRHPGFDRTTRMPRAPKVRSVKRPAVKSPPVVRRTNPKPAPRPTVPSTPKTDRKKKKVKKTKNL